MADVEVDKYLWEEFRYRHDLIWRLLFRVTTVAVLLSIAPFTIDDLVRRNVGSWVNALPALALALVLGSWPMLVLEFRLFRPVDALSGIHRNSRVEMGLPTRKKPSHLGQCG